MTNDIGPKLDKLRLAVEGLNARSDARHEGVCSQLHTLHAGLEGVRSAQSEHGKAIAGLRSVCAGRQDACGGIQADLRQRQQRHSDEIAKLSNGVRDASQVTAIADIRRSEWKRVLLVVWGVTWKVVLAAGALGLLGNAVAETVKLMR